MFFLLEAASPAIPYRTDAPLAIGNIAFAIAVVLLALVLLVVLAYYAKRRGWLSALSKPAATPSQNRLQLRASQRLSLHSTAHVLAYQGRDYLVIESTRQTTAVLSPLDKPEISTDEIS